jgi:hypothetical protein
LALINYDSTKTYLPALRKRLDGTDGKLGGKDEKNNELPDTPGTIVQASWVGLLLPYIEQVTAWERLSGWNNQVSKDKNIFDLQLPTLKCKSDTVEETRISYVANGGYQNAAGDWSDDAITPAPDPARREDTPFIDHVYTSKTTTVSLDYISTHNGTSNTLLLSENLQSGQWIYKGNGWGQESDGVPKPPTTDTDTAYPAAADERHIAFCYPVNKLVTCASNAWDPPSGPLVYLKTGGHSQPDEANGNASWNGYLSDNYQTNNPLFINLARVPETFSGITGGAKGYNLARPSSNHPGIVIAAFADRGTKPLNQTMSTKIFVHICQPSSGAIITTLE